ncbi:hypothetical protein ABEB36_010607 [Hypothenemus hampei]|uniref:Transcription factor Adf-1 n=1 Tax=Hypothenemus hampei TaxID=57062 RepID=A0ABD1EEL1_HYPHA
MKMDIEKLILCVEAKRPLWDQKTKEYHNRIIVKKLWEAVAEEVGESSSIVKSKWRNLRDNFRRELSKSKNYRSGDAAGPSKKSKWAYFEILSFLRDTFNSRPSSGNINFPELGETDIGTGEDSNDVSNEIEFSENFILEDPETNGGVHENNMFRSSTTEKIISDYCEKLQTKTTKKDNIQEQLLQIEQKKLETFSKLSANSGDSDYNFMMSILPFLKTLPPLKKMKMRLDIQQLFLTN